VITDAELRGLIMDCLRLWEAGGNVTAAQPRITRRSAGAARGFIQATRCEQTTDGLRVGACVVRRGEAPMRWLVQTPARTRAAPSVVALLSLLRREVGVTDAPRLRVGY
jgi:hypothetical protein